MQRSICCTCSWGGQWRCLPRCCTSPPPPRPPWTCTRCWPGASWGCPPRRARWPWGSRRARPVLWGRVPPIDRRSWTPSDFNIKFGQNQLFSPHLQHHPSETCGRSFPEKESLFQEKCQIPAQNLKMHFLVGVMFSQAKCTLLGLAWGKRRKLPEQSFKLCKN